MATPEPYDVTVIGAGLVGLSTAMQLLERHPRLRLVVVEKDLRAASQQSGHNSGVIHSGIYYKPGSFKARFSVEGRNSMFRFCLENDVPTLKCGKLIVATHPGEAPRLETLFERGQANGVEGLELVGPERIREIEPHISAVCALWAPGTGIVDFGRVAEVYVRKILAAGGEIRFGTLLKTITRRGRTTRLITSGGEIDTRTIVNCAGLHADVVARMGGLEPGLRIIPFRGEYYRLRKDREHLVRGLIYPVPDPAFPFLGVHFSRTMKGGVEAGPNAILALKREGYRKRDISLAEVAGILTYPGFWYLAAREWKTGLWEIDRSFRKTAFVRSLRKLLPEIAPEDLSPGGSGVRAQAVASDGGLIDDFRIEQEAHGVHVLNAPSPGATASLVIGRHVARLSEHVLGLAP